MNAKKMNRINLQAKVILAEWLAGLMSEVEATKISVAKVRDLLPQQTHIFTGDQLRLSAFSFKWTVKRIKKLARQHPERPVESFLLSEVHDV